LMFGVKRKNAFYVAAFFLKTGLNQAQQSG
jgi:hypothetical protein